MEKAGVFREAGAAGCSVAAGVGAGFLAAGFRAPAAAAGVSCTFDLVAAVDPEAAVDLEAAAGVLTAVDFLAGGFPAAAFLWRPASGPQLPWCRLWSSWSP